VVYTENMLTAATVTAPSGELLTPVWVLAAVWWLALGGIVGSFLNVVVYRLPLKLSLVWPGSHCPACQHPIRWHDNIPVLGWLMLAGRCRDCRTRISPRYPLVEALTAVVFLSVALAECLSGGANLPAGWRALADLGQRPGGQLVALWKITFFHVMLLGTLLPAALIHHDGQRLPWRWALPALVVGLLAPAAWPALHPVPAFHGLHAPWVVLVDSVCGAACGLAGGWLAARLAPVAQRAGVILASVLIGLYLGWQLGAAILLAAVLLFAAMRVLRRQHDAPLPLLAWLAATTFSGIVFWRQVIQCFPCLG